MTNQSQNQQVAAIPPAINNVRKFFAANKQRVTTALPSHLDANRMLGIAMTEIRKVPELAECQIESLFGAVIQASQLGLEPGGALGHCYLLPFNNKKKGIKECQFILGYRGMIDLARRSGQILSLQAHAVYEGDKFEFEYGLNERLVHVPSDNPSDKLTYVYAVAKLVGGGHQFEVMSKAQIEKIRLRSKGGDYGPWSTDYEPMAKKTVIRQLFKYLPVSIEFSRAIVADEKAEAGVSQDNSSILDAEFSIGEEVPQEAPATKASAMADRLATAQ